MDLIEGYNKGCDYYDGQEFEKAIQEWSSIPIENKLYGDALNGIASAYIKLNECDKAIELIESVISTQNKDIQSKLFGTLGNAYFAKEEYRLAKNEYKHSLLLEEENPKMLYNMGLIFAIEESHDLAVSYFEQALFLFQKTEQSGTIFLYLYHNLGVTYCQKGIHLDPSERKFNFEKAIFNSVKALELSSKFQEASENLIKCYLYLGDESNFIETFRTSDLDEYLIIREISSFLETSKITDAKIIDEVLMNFLKPVLNAKMCLYKSVLDQEKLKKGKIKEEKYLKIYYKMIEIINMLHVKQGARDDSEDNVAHYTRKNIAENLLFSKSLFRLNTILAGNDPKEGITLLDSLNISNGYDNDFSCRFQAFIGCFTFNHECLNQFRLYGKENSKEATGVSIVVNHTFFSEYSSLNLFESPLYNDCNSSNLDSIDTNSNRSSLYRCIYLDPQTGMIASVGSREHYTFYRELNCKIKRSEADKKVSAYSKQINTLLSKLRSKFYDFQRSVNARITAKEVSESNIRELLLPLRLLTKHVAFKEEQECRILRIESLKENLNLNIKPERKEDGQIIEIYDSMYIDYKPKIKNSVVKVFFAPNAEGFHLFRDNVQTHDLNVKCQKSQHPFNNK